MQKNNDKLPIEAKYWQDNDQKVHVLQHDSVEIYPFRLYVFCNDLRKKWKICII